MVEKIVLNFERFVVERNLLDSVRSSLIHGDANDFNVLVDKEGNQVTGFLDFGDMVYSYLVNDLAIAVAYGVMKSPEPLNSLYVILQGFQTELPLEKNELEGS